MAPGGNVAYGYRREGKRIVLDTLEADVVRKIFRLAEEGLSGAVIATMLNERKASRRNGGPWTQRQVAAILARRGTYIDGLVKYGAVEGKNKDLAFLSDACA